MHTNYEIVTRIHVSLKDSATRVATLLTVIGKDVITIIYVFDTLICDELNDEKKIEMVPVVEI